MVRKFFKKMHNTFTPFAVWGFVFGGGMTLFSSFPPAWITEDSKNVIGTIGIVLMIASAIGVIIVAIRTPEAKAYPSVQLNVWN